MSLQTVAGTVAGPLLARPAAPTTNNLIPDRLELGCKTTYVEECHNEYKMVCEETTVERDREVCHTVQEKVCQHQEKIDYEPACFQQITSHCDKVRLALAGRPLIFSSPLRFARERWM